MMSEANSSAKVRQIVAVLHRMSISIARRRRRWLTLILACFVEGHDAEQTPLTFRLETAEDGRGLQAAHHLCSDDAHGR
jgi:hypothetical protein